jgi:pimeloyl-ACP methyl ester carboxylesterase
MYATNPDGTLLFYDEHGAGEPAIIFVHSLGNHEHYRHQIDHFAGFGASTARPERDYTFASWAEDLAWLCEQLHVRAAVIVGHSMSGPIVLELAASHPALVRAAVLLDPVPIVPLPTFSQGLVRLVQALQGPHYRDALRRFAEERQFRATDDPGLRSRLIGDMCSVPQHVLVSVFSSILAWDGQQVVPGVQAPILQIVQGGGMPADLVRVQEIVPDFELGRTVGAGHWAHLIVPDQVNSMIERFLAIHSPEPLVPGESHPDSALMGDR